MTITPSWRRPTQYVPSYADKDYSSVTLSLHMDGANNSTTFTDSSSSPLTVTPNGNVKISTTQAKFGGASGYFDGNGDFLSVAYNTGIDLIGSDFTVECWVYAETIKSSTRIAATGGGLAGFNSTNGIHWLMQLVTGGLLQIQIRNTVGAGAVTSVASVPINTWTHIAFCVSGSTGYIYINGVGASGALGTLQRPSTNPTLNIASIPGEGGGSTVAFQGYIDDFRITKGVARYLADFTPSTTVNADSFETALTCISPGWRRSSYLFTGNSPSLLLHMNGADNSTTFTDSSLNAFTVTPYGDAKISTTQSKFGGASGYFDGTGDYLKVTNNTAFDFGSGDFTLEMFIYIPSTITLQRGILNKGAWPFGRASFLISTDANSGGRILFSASSSSASFDIAQDRVFAVAPTLNTWHHIAICRSGNNFYGFWNGAQAWTFTSSASLWSNSNDLYIMAGDLGYNVGLGYIDELRIIKGKAEYTEAFTPTAIELPNPT